MTDTGSAGPNASGAIPEDRGSRLLTLVGDLMRRRSKRTDRVLLTLALVLFVGGGVLALRALPPGLGPIRWIYLLLAAFVGVPMTTFLNAQEYTLAGRLLGHEVGTLAALRISVIGAATNLLPIPGSVLVRIAGLRQQGSAVGRATGATITIGVAWLGLTCLIAGSFLAVQETRSLGLAFAGVGAVILGVSMVLMRSLSHHWVRCLGRILLVETAAVLTAATRFFLVMAALGVDANFAQAVTLTISGALASAVGLFPGGLGLREAISAALSPLIGLTATIGFLTTAIDRLMGIVVHLPITAAVFVASRRTTKTERRDEIA
jgi:uncharacterized membrane protein YbhN (UPF0104 family)